LTEVEGHAVGIKVGAKSLQIAWRAGEDIELGRIADLELLPTNVGMRGGQLTPLDPRSIGDSSESQFVQDVPRLLVSGSAAELTMDGRLQQAEELMTVLLQALVSAADVVPDFAAVSVPGWCSAAQREALRGAARSAGIARVSLIDHAVAAVEGVSLEPPNPGSYLVFHLGATSFDAALVEIDATGGEVVDRELSNDLSGRTVDADLADYLAYWMLRHSHRLSDFTSDNPAHSSAFRRLQSEAERLKLVFARPRASEMVSVNLELVLRDQTPLVRAVSYELRRIEVEGVVNQTLDRAISLTRRLLARANAKQRAILGLVFSGGMTLWPSLRERVMDRLAVHAGAASDPLSVVVRGAAAYAVRTSSRYIDDVAPTSKEATLTRTRPTAHLLSQQLLPIRLGTATSIGRSADCSVVLDDSRVSRDHAAIEWDESRVAFVLVDHRSTWGTLINDERLVPFQPRVLDDEDIIDIVGHRFRVRLA
jgi:molecular chaperone DnaK (HSP70)